MGPLEGVRILEIAGIGPGPFAAMMLSDMGAEVLRIDRMPDGPGRRSRFEILNRGRRSAAVNLKHPEGVSLLLDLVASADALIEGFRPGVMERLGLGPEVCLERNPRLVYGRMTGWGQEGPIAHAAGHDINYIALAGALEPIGRKGQPPTPPLNLVGDFGGGGMLLAYGLVCALVERNRSGLGQVVDAAMVDGAAALLAAFFGVAQAGQLGERGTNTLDSGAPFYDAYETADGKYVSVGSIEPQFYAEFLERLGLGEEELPPQMEREAWPVLKERVAKIFKQRTRDEWCAIMEGSDVCFAPVLTPSEAPEHAQAAARNSFVEVEGVIQPHPAPRFSRTRAEIQRPPAAPGQHTREALTDWGVASDRIAALFESGALA